MAQGPNYGSLQSRKDDRECQVGDPLYGKQHVRIRSQISLEDNEQGGDLDFKETLAKPHIQALLHCCIKTKRKGSHFVPAFKSCSEEGFMASSMVVLLNRWKTGLREGSSSLVGRCQGILVGRGRQCTMPDETILYPPGMMLYLLPCTA